MYISYRCGHSSDIEDSSSWQHEYENGHEHHEPNTINPVSVGEFVQQCNLTTNDSNIQTQVLTNQLRTRPLPVIPEESSYRVPAPTTFEEKARTLPPLPEQQEHFYHVPVRPLPPLPEQSVYDVPAPIAAKARIMNMKKTEKKPNRNLKKMEKKQRLVENMDLSQAKNHGQIQNIPVHCIKNQSKLGPNTKQIHETHL